ncbi:MAG: hypothetical protein J5595_01915 [Bacteroidales bacterium]|nr:hypothetical protein [Bacteroidales bacterium]
MKVRIEYANANSTQEDLLGLKEFIAGKKIEGVSRVSIATAKAVKGAAGEGLASAVTAVLGTVTGALTRLMDALVEWVKLKRSEIRITGTSGAEICISGKVKEKDLEKALEKFYAQEKSNVNAGAQLATKPTPPPQPAKNDEKK